MTDRALLYLRLVAEAKERGISWNQLARTLGAADGKTAKREAKRLARDTQRRLLAAKPGELADAPVTFRAAMRQEVEMPQPPEGGCYFPIEGGPEPSRPPAGRASAGDAP